MTEKQPTIGKIATRNEFRAYIDHSRQKVVKTKDLLENSDGHERKSPLFAVKTFQESSKI